MKVMIFSGKEKSSEESLRDSNRRRSCKSLCDFKDPEVLIRRGIDDDPSSE